MPRADILAAVRAIIAALSAALALTTTTRAVAAQDVASAPRWEFLVSSGRMVPTGSQRTAIKSGNATTAQLWYAVRPTLALSAHAGWTRSRDLATTAQPRLDVFSYDVGVEARAPRSLGLNAFSIRPFAGLGAGGRSYNSRSVGVRPTHNLAAYGSAGGELGLGRVRLRVEARDYLTGFTAAARNDVAVMVGMRFNVR